MFSAAIQLATQFTRPVIVSKRFRDGRLQCGCATFFIINPEGWFLTAAHLMNDLLTATKHLKELKEYEEQAAAIKADASLNAKQRKRRFQQLRPNRDWITNVSYWWGSDRIKVENIHIDSVVDLAIGKLQRFDSSRISSYPVFKNPRSEFLQGVSLCRLGFPFADLKVSFDQATKRFVFLDGVEVPLFPIDGILTRFPIGMHQASKRIIKCIETSSPGLRGQSGGPIFDVHGVVWGMQSRTTTLPLGFTPKTIQSGKVVQENQFINIGIGIHVEEIIRFLDKYQVRYDLAADQADTTGKSRDNRWG